MAKEYIDREVAIEAIKNDLPNIVNYRKADATECLETLPSADVEEVRHGEWKVVYQNKVATVYECSKCGYITLGTSDYCICGAKMDGKD